MLQTCVPYTRSEVAVSTPKSKTISLIDCGMKTATSPVVNTSLEGRALEIFEILYFISKMSAVLHFYCKILLSHILLCMMSPLGPRCHQLLRTGGLFAEMIRLQSAKPCPSPIYFPTSPRPYCPVLFTENPGGGWGRHLQVYPNAPFSQAHDPFTVCP